MADHSKIEWTDDTWNPLRGCSRVSDGCRNCYAEKVAARFSGPGLPYEGLIHASTRGWNGQVHIAHKALDFPLRKKEPRKIFVNSMSDLFHESVNDVTIAGIFGIMAACPHHTFQVLTKRPERMRKWFQWMGWQKPRVVLHGCTKGLMGYDHPRRPAINDGPWPLPNVWLGVSVENQATADKRIPWLLQCPAAVRWLSCEPMLGPIDLERVPRLVEFHRSPYGWKQWLAQHLHWLVAGGESGPRARPMHPGWARSLRDQCASAGVPFFFKQWGAWAPRRPGVHGDGVTDSPAVHLFPDGYVASNGDAFRQRPEQSGNVGQVMWRVGKHAAGRLLDGVEHNGFPETRA